MGNLLELQHYNSVMCYLLELQHYNSVMRFSDTESSCPVPAPMWRCGFGDPAAVCGSRHRCGSVLVRPAGAVRKEKR